MISNSVLARDPVSSAVESLNHLPAGALAVHLDVDVLDFIDAPLAENADGRNTGRHSTRLRSRSGSQPRHAFSDHVNRRVEPDPKCRRSTNDSPIHRHNHQGFGWCEELVSWGAPQRREGGGGSGTD